MSNYIDDLIYKLIDLSVVWILCDEARNTVRQAAKEIQRLSDENERLKRSMRAG